MEFCRHIETLTLEMFVDFDL